MISSEQLDSEIAKYHDRIQHFLHDLVRFNTTNEDRTSHLPIEDSIIHRIIQECADLKLPYKIYEQEPGRPNLYIGRPENFSKHDGLLFISHADTVPAGDVRTWTHNPYNAIEEDGKLYGVGTMDCKAGIALSVYALKALFDLGITSAKAIVGVDEESGADKKYGLAYTLDEGLDANSAIYTYGGRPEEIIIGHRGLLRYWLEVHGKAEHTGLIKGKQAIGVNAIEYLIKTIGEIHKIKMPEEPNKYFPRYNFRVTATMVSGGVGESIVPPSAQVLFDVRLMPGQDIDEYLEKVKKLIIKLDIENPEVTMEVQVKNHFPAVLISEDEPIVQILKKIITDEGMKPVVKGAGPANEGYMFIHKGIPTICGYGVAGGRFHQPDEFIQIDSIDPTMKRYIQCAIEINESSIDK